MHDLHIVVCMKVVPKPEEIRVDTATSTLVREGVRSEINPPDMNALELALKMKGYHGGQVDILSMGPSFFEQPLRACLAMGADRLFLLSDRAFAGADTLATTYTLWKGIEKIRGVNLVLCGEESSDGATGQVPSGIAEWLGWSQITMVGNLELLSKEKILRGKREVPGGYAWIEASLPAVVSVVSACNEPRFMDYQVKDWAFSAEPLTVWGSNDLDVDPGFIGLTGSPTRVSGLKEADVRTRRRITLDGTPDEIAGKLVEVVLHQMDKSG